VNLWQNFFENILPKIEKIRHKQKNCTAAMYWTYGQKNRMISTCSFHWKYGDFEPFFPKKSSVQQVTAPPFLFFLSQSDEILLPQKRNPNCYMMVTETPDAFQWGIQSSIYTSEN